MTKALYTAIIAITALLATTSCRRANHDGKLDGNWRVESVENLSTGETVVPDEVFIAIQCELLQFRRYAGGKTAHITGVIDYSRKEHTLAVDFPYDVRHSASALNYYLFTDYTEADLADRKGVSVTFDVEKVNSKSLVLRSPYALYRCRRF